MSDHPRSLLKSIMLWIGLATAVLAFIFGVQQIYNQLVTKVRSQEEVDMLIESSQVRMESKDYAQTWKILAEADQYDVMNLELIEAKAEVAMLWLQNMQSSEKAGNFADQVALILPVLERAAVTLQGMQQADVIAHLGWADYLRQREGNFGLNPDKYYEKALSIDPDNAYANTMYGHLLMSSMMPDKRDYEKGWRYLQDAEKQNRQTAYVRGMQFAALKNEDSSNIKFIALLSEMITNSEPISDELVSRTLDSQYAGLGFDRFDKAFRSGKAVRSSVSLEEDIAVFRWIWQEHPHMVERYRLYQPYIKAIFTESSGDTATANRLYRELQAGLPDNKPQRFRSVSYMEKAIDRTSNSTDQTELISESP